MKSFTTKNYKWSLEGLCQCIEDNKLKSAILFYTDTAAIVHVKSYEDSVVLGAVSDWCISQHSSSWRQYVERNNCVQVFIYNFAKKPNDDDSLIGATYDVKGDSPGKVVLVCSFTRPNNPLRTLDGGTSDSVTMKRRILSPIFGKCFKLDDVIISIKKNGVLFKDEHVNEVSEMSVYEPNSDYNRFINDYYDKPDITEPTTVESWHDFFTKYF